jgi:hypothetical protein
MAAIRKRGSKWQARVKRNGQTLDKSFRTKADAQRWARTIEAEIERGAFRPYLRSSQLTLEAALRRYGQEITPQKRGAAFEQCRIRTLTKHPLAQKTLVSIRAIDVAAYRDERRQAGRSDQEFTGSIQAVDIGELQIKHRDLRIGQAGERRNKL